MDGLPHVYRQYQYPIVEQPTVQVDKPSYCGGGGGATTDLKTASKRSRKHSNTILFPKVRVNGLNKYICR